MDSPRCPNQRCPRKQSAVDHLIRFGFYRTRWGKRRRFRCRCCGKTFCRNKGTDYYRIQHRRATFDQVATLSVEGVNNSAISRATQISWNMADRWLEKSACSPAGIHCRRPARLWRSGSRRPAHRRGSDRIRAEGRRTCPASSATGISEVLKVLTIYKTTRAHFSVQPKIACIALKIWSGRRDLNPGPLAPQADYESP